MTSVWNSAIFLLLVTGSMLGLSLPLGKLATAAGSSAILWAAVISIGAGGLLALVLAARRRPVALTGHFLRYSLIAAAISYAIPNLLMFSVVPRLGAGYAGLMFTLSPLFTLAFSILLRMSRPSALGVAGVAVGFVGALLVAWSRIDGAVPADPFWVGVGLAIPIVLAAGNVYRTFDWPAESGPLELAAGSHLAAAGMLVAGMAASGRLGDFAVLPSIPVLVAAQMASAALMFTFYFRLQAVGGPIYLSQIGYVAAALGLVSGTLFLGETYGLLTWAGAAIVAAGVVMTTKAQLSAR